MNKTDSTNTNDNNYTCEWPSVTVGDPIGTGWIQSPSIDRNKKPIKHPHYNNEHGSLYKIAEQLGLNAYEFDILKRIARCRKKGQFEQDLQKIKDTVDLYLKEHVQ